jgi:hypothetical protein
MDFPADCSTFWTACVCQGKPCTVTVPEDTECALTNAALAQEASNPEIGRVVLYATVNGEPPVAIIPFTIGVFESSTIDLHFASGDTIIFTSNGAAVSIHISGYLTGGLSVNINSGGQPELPPAE